MAIAIIICVLNCVINKSRFIITITMKITFTILTVWRKERILISFLLSHICKSIILAFLILRKIFVLKLYLFLKICLIIIISLILNGILFINFIVPSTLKFHLLICKILFIWYSNLSASLGKVI